ncbi:MAG: peptidoglycan DD-metalloendopeptidase family protein [Clostridia bacterium]|nr:peptidoglycan DD-metalloendopeptidase family protein [Clostridia bacterium]
MRSKMSFKKIVSVLLIVTGFVCYSGLSSYAESAAALRDKIAAADKKIQQAEKELSEAKKKQASAEKQKEIIDDKIEQIVANIVYINTGIDNANTQIAQKEEEILVAQEKLDTNKSYFKKRVVSMYKSGATTYLDMLFGADSIADFFSRMDMLSYVLKNDKKIVEDMTNARDAVVEAKKVIEERKAELEVSRELAQEQKETLDKTLAQQQMIVDKLGAQVKVNQQEAAAAQREKDALNAQLERELAGYTQPPTQGAAYAGGKMAWPTPQGGTITSPYGYRTYPSNGLHTGLDIGIKMGSTIVAAEAGTVVKVINGTTGYGKYLIVNHGNGVMTLYAHTSKIIVGVGQYVNRGEKIAEIGSTGFSTGPHLHFEVRINGKAVNPIGYIT